MNLSIILILVFLTTPASLLNLASFSTTLKDFLSFNWVDKSGKITKFLFRSLLPSILITLIRELLMFIINLTVDKERHYRFSYHQRSQLRKIFVYLLFNLIIVPGFAGTALTNLFDIFRLGVNNFVDFLKELFVLSNGNFFLVYMITNAGGTFWTSINASGLLFKNYFTPAIVVETTLYIRENEGWRKDNGMIYGWGPTYAVNLVITGIAIMFQ